MTYPVFLGRCDEYDPEAVASVILAALEAVPLQVPLSGRVVIKPNVVMAHPKVARDAYTRKEVVEGILRAIRRKGEDVQRVDIVEKSGLGVTTAGMFRWAGYNDLPKRYPVTLCPMEERRQRKVGLRRGRVHACITVAREMAERDFLIFAPKLKTNVLSQAYSGALKLNIGTIDGKERMHHHDRDIHVKIVDILEAANPDLIVTDGIRFCFGGNQMTQAGMPFGVIAVATNAVAHDMVCARLLGLDPFKIEHIVEAIERGYGPKSFEEIKILGDFPLERGQALVKGRDLGLLVVDEFPCNFKIHAGSPYCTGGCHGVFLDWLLMIKDLKPGLLKRFPKLTALVGKVDEPIEDRTVLLVGNCAQASPAVKARRIVRIKGCPPNHRQIITYMACWFLLFGPFVRPSLIFDSYVLYPLKKLKGWLINLFPESKPPRVPDVRVDRASADRREAEMDKVA